MRNGWGLTEVLLLLPSLCSNLGRDLGSMAAQSSNAAETADLSFNCHCRSKQQTAQQTVVPGDGVILLTNLVSFIDAWYRCLVLNFRGYEPGERGHGDGDRVKGTLGVRDHESFLPWRR